MNTKRLLCALCAICATLTLCSCSLRTPVVTEWYEDLPTATLPPDTADEDPLASYLEGNWVTEGGVSEPIGGGTVKGSPYTVKSIKKESNGNIVATVSVNNSDVVYTVYRYKTGYAEYSYMEALFTAKDIIIKYSK